jgi:hypothetical protein
MDFSVAVGIFQLTISLCEDIATQNTPGRLTRQILPIGLKSRCRHSLGLDFSDILSYVARKVIEMTLYQ